jgi:hypothetical protein
MNAVYRIFERERIPTPGRQALRPGVLPDSDPGRCLQAPHLRGGRGTGIAGGCVTPRPRAALRHLLVQPPAGAHSPGIRAVGKRTPLPHRGALHGETRGRVGSRPGPLRGYTPRSGRRGDQGQPPRIERRATLLGALRRHPALWPLRTHHSHAEHPGACRDVLPSLLQLPQPPKPRRCCMHAPEEPPSPGHRGASVGSHLGSAARPGAPARRTGRDDRGRACPECGATRKQRPWPGSARSPR